jgi:methanogenic corrinoid protein MtbC1
VLDELMIPLEREIGDRWHAGKSSVAQEHLLTTVIRSRLLVLVHGTPRGAGDKALLACFPEEEHDVGTWAAALRLRYRGWRIAVLGARTPVNELVQSVKAYQPRLVGLSAIADPGKGTIAEVLTPLREVLPRGARILVGGAGAEHRAGEVKAAGAQIAPPGWEATLPERAKTPQRAGRPVA